MNAQEFVDILKQVVQDQAVSDTIENLLEPPGKRPSPEMLQMSAFFLGLSEDQQSIFRQIIHMVSETTLFGVLCVLDGVRTIEDDENKGKLRLIFAKNGSDTLLNDPNEDFLHDLL